jgi:hypothetical protein
VLRKSNVRVALKNLLEEKRRNVDVEVADVARYWYDIATADPRELSQHIRVGASTTNISSPTARCGLPARPTWPGS